MTYLSAKTFSIPCYFKKQNTNQIDISNKVEECHKIGISCHKNINPPITQEVLWIE